MRQKTLTRYLISEVLPPFFFGLLVFTFILLIARILKLIELVITRGVPLIQTAKLFSLILPTFLELTVPMAFLLAILLGLGRLSGDQELLAMKASGISPTQILLAHRYRRGDHRYHHLVANYVRTTRSQYGH